MLHQEPDKNRCVLILKIGGTSMEAYDPQQWNADPSQFTLAGLPSIVKPLIDGFTNPVVPPSQKKINLRTESHAPV